ncbi:MAG: MFS transporter [Rhizobiales bacterium]|nr:MFS transporter [Hyphomicrobiales bacterium]
MITAPSASSERRHWASPTVVIVAGCLIALIGFGVRSTFGLFLEPITVAQSWDRETFAIALAIQNLLWGLGVPFAGALADKFGPARVIAIGAVIYALGVAGITVASEPTLFHLAAGVATGLGVAFTSFSLALAAMAKVVGPERRSLVFGLGTAAGSFGQVVFSPLGQAFIDGYGWMNALMLLSGAVLLVLPLAFVLPRGTQSGTVADAEQTVAAAIREAFAHQGFVLLTVGFFVCGFHVAFIAVHFPAYVSDLGLGPEVGAYALALVGLCNIVGSFLSGMVGQVWSKRMGLSVIYFSRAVVIAALLMAPKSATTIYLFAAAMGILWLSTVPLTTGIVAQVFGLRYMATLSGIVFFSHQIGSFTGVWLGGYLYDTTGSYDGVWQAGVVLGLLAALIHLPIDERPLARLRAPAVP